MKAGNEMVFAFHFLGVLIILGTLGLLVRCVHFQNR